MSPRSTTTTVRRGRRTPVARCSGCRAEPRLPAEHLDLATEWLLPGPADRAPVVRRFCRGCAPTGPVTEILCARCGDGPLLAGELTVMDLHSTAVVDAWLERAGWWLPGPVCPDCVGERSR